MHSFFPSCGQYLSSCHQVVTYCQPVICQDELSNNNQENVIFTPQVEQDTEAAGLILGCLFSQYPSLMIPLLSNEEQLDTNII